MLEIRDLHASAGDKEILRGIDLTVNAGEVHAVMGPNGSGKSTLAQVLAGHPAYEVTGGSVIYRGQDLLELEPEARAQAGVFLAFQYPVEIPGVTNAYFLRAAYNEIRKARGEEEIDSMDFLDLLEEKLKLVEWDPEIMSRAVNSGFSGGEKKRNEILQMAVLEPTLAILDETDSGLDIDALRIVAAGVNKLRAPGQRHHRGDPLPAPAQLHRARLRARAVRRPDREVGRQGAGARARGPRLRVARGRGGSRVMTEAFVQEFEARAGTATAEGPEWLEPVRRAAMERFARTGFPGARDEEWRFTPIGPIAQGTWRPATGAAGELDARAARAVRLRPRRLDHAGLRERRLQRGAERRGRSCRAGVRVASLAEALRSDGALLHAHLTRHAAGRRLARSPRSTPPSWREGGVVHVAAGVDLAAPVHLLFVTTAEAGGTVAHPRNLIVVERGARASIIESYVTLAPGQSYWTNPVTEVAVGAGAWVEHTRIQRESESALPRRAHPRRPAARQPLPLVLARDGRRRWRGTTCTCGSTTRTSRP